MVIEPYKNQYLKFFTLVRKYIVAKYGLTSQILDIMLFLDSERIFNKSQFEKWETLFGLVGVNFYELWRRKLIIVFDKDAKLDEHGTRYCLSYESKLIVKECYELCSGRRLFKENFSDKYFQTSKSVKRDRRILRSILLVNERTKALKEKIKEQELLRQLEE